jgi:hypothetical protein
MGSQGIFFRQHSRGTHEDSKQPERYDRSLPAAELSHPCLEHGIFADDFALIGFGNQRSPKNVGATAIRMAGAAYWDCPRSCVEADLRFRPVTLEWRIRIAWTLLLSLDSATAESALPSQTTGFSVAVISR